MLLLTFFRWEIGSLSFSRDSSKESQCALFLFLTNFPIPRSWSEVCSIFMFSSFMLARKTFNLGEWRFACTYYVRLCLKLVSYSVMQWYTVNSNEVLWFVLFYFMHDFYLFLYQYKKAISMNFKILVKKYSYF